MYRKWTTEVPQYKNGVQGQFRGSCVGDNASWDLASYRRGYNSATVYTGWHVGFRLAFATAEL